jgi:hypothetical protein
MTLLFALWPFECAKAPGHALVLVPFPFEILFWDDSMCHTIQLAVDPEVGRHLLRTMLDCVIPRREQCFLR